jgi:HTH-type transcriptional regulator/antitoxin HigA
MSTIELTKTLDAWSLLSHQIYVPHTEAEYDHLVMILDELIDEVGENETHPLASLMEIIGVLIENYENQHIPELLEENL